MLFNLYIVFYAKGIQCLFSSNNGFSIDDRRSRNHPTPRKNHKNLMSFKCHQEVGNLPKRSMDCIPFSICYTLYIIPCMLFMVLSALFPCIVFHSLWWPYLCEQHIFQRAFRQTWHKCGHQNDLKNALYFIYSGGHTFANNIFFNVGFAR